MVKMGEIKVLLFFQANFVFLKIQEFTFFLYKVVYLEYNFILIFQGVPFRFKAIYNIHWLVISIYKLIFRRVTSIKYFHIDQLHQDHFQPKCVVNALVVWIVQRFKPIVLMIRWKWNWSCLFKQNVFACYLTFLIFFFTIIDKNVTLLISITRFLFILLKFQKF